MTIPYPTAWPQFYTATINNWNYFLKSDESKMIIIDSLKYLTEKKIIELNAYVIMDNHIHLIWKPLLPFTLSQIQLRFMRFTAQKLLYEIRKQDISGTEHLKVNKKDRNYQVWKRNPLNVVLFTDKVFFQKFDYIHCNPVKAGLCLHPEDYKFSSAAFYHSGVDPFGIITHYAA